MACPVEIQLETSLDGVFYVQGRTGSWPWRVASLAPDWLQEISALGEKPTSMQIKALEARHIFVGSPGRQDTDLILMCCGLGSAWPGMGRELYANFPVARQAMDRVAALADWDILALMDDPDLANISQTRWQIPYLFTLEYGQWMLLESMGLRPDIVCGHSLGELIALCVSGILSLEAAWLLLETRARHMAELEASGNHQGGMLAVPAPLEVVEAICGQYPDLRISNRNTEKQFVLSGPRPQLLEARRHLRRQRVPAVMLGMNLAFHNPAMRILRDISLHLLSYLRMDPAKVPLISCVDCRPYPTDPAAICTSIADLDENAVDWHRLVGSIMHRSQEPLFVELGPQETLCSITTEQAPHARCLGVDRKGHETVAMRVACAKLFAASYLDVAKIATLACAPVSEPLPTPPPSSSAEEDCAALPKDAVELVQKLIGESCGRKAREVDPGLDLRRDLGIRSSNFPFILLEAERRLGSPVSLDSLIQLTTVADLVRLIAGLPAPEIRPVLSRSTFDRTRRRLVRYVADGTCIRQKPISFDASGIVPKRDAARILLIQNTSAPLLHWVQVALEALGCDVTVLPWPHWRQLASTLGDGDWKGILCLVEADGEGKNLKKSSSNTLNVVSEHFKALHCDKPWVVTLTSAYDSVCDSGAWRDAARNILHALEKTFSSFSENKNIILIGSAPVQNGLDWADMLTLELAHGGKDRAIWSNLPDQVAYTCPQLSASVDLAEPVGEYPPGGDGSEFAGTVQFSSTLGGAFAEGDLPNPAEEPGIQCESWLPPGEILRAMAEINALALPWLSLMGFWDLRVDVLPAMPQGVIRQGEFSAKSRMLLPLEGVSTRFCSVRLNLGAIQANGRRTGATRSLADGSCLSGVHMAPIRPLWAGTVGANLSGMGRFQHWPGREDQVFGKVSSLDILAGGVQGRGYEAVLSLGRVENIFSLVDAVLLAALWTIAQSGDALASLRCWRFSSIAFIRFGENTAYRKLQWRLSWQDDTLLRFDAQALGEADQVLAIVHSLEFDRTASADEMPQGGI